MYIIGDRDNEFSIISANVNGLEDFSNGNDFFPYKSTSLFVASISHIFESIYNNVYSLIYIIKIFRYLYMVDLMEFTIL